MSGVFIYISLFVNRRKVFLGSGKLFFSGNFFFLVGFECTQRVRVRVRLFMSYLTSMDFLINVKARCRF